MPGFITHLMLKEQISSSYHNSTWTFLVNKHPSVYNLGLEGPDLFFYHIPAYLFHKHNIGNLMHDYQVNAMFEALFYVRDCFDSDYQDICDAYIMGFMGHYTLDYCCHPYIYYKSTHFDNLKVSHKYDFGRHCSLETDIDQLLLEHFYGIKPSHYNYAARITLSAEERQVVSLMLSQAISIAFPNEKISNSLCKGATKSFVFLNKLMRDPSGWKKSFVSSIDNKLFHCPVVSVMIPSDSKFAYSDPCNESHLTWHNLWDDTTDRTESIYDMLNIAGSIYKKRLEMYITGIASFEDKTPLLDELGNNSYCNGLPIK